MLSPAMRKLALTAHVATSVGWMGAVAAFLGLAAVGLASGDEGQVRGAYVAMGPLGWFVILPLCLASLATGLVQSLGTHWGLVRHYWVLLKLGINVVSTLILLVHMAPITQISTIALAGPLHPGEHQELRVQMLVASLLALLALLAATVLSVYKPKGETGWGRRADAGA